MEFAVVFVTVPGKKASEISKKSSKPALQAA